MRDTFYKQVTCLHRDEDTYLVIKHVHEVSIERMDVLKLGEFCQDKCELFRKICLCKFHFPHVKAADSGDLVVLVDHRGGLPLGLGQHDVREVRAGRHHADLLEVIVRHLDGYD